MDDFRDYIEFAEQYLLEADKDVAHTFDKSKYLVPATILAWASVEALVNNMLDDFGNLPENLFALHERAFLLERKIKFVDSGPQTGTFILDGNEYRRLEEKIFFLISKFGSSDIKGLEKGESLWQQFKLFKETRDNLVHPRRSKIVHLSTNQVETYINTAKELIQT